MKGGEKGRREKIKEGKRGREQFSKVVSPVIKFIPQIPTCTHYMYIYISIYIYIYIYITTQTNICFYTFLCLS